MSSRAQTPKAVHLDVSRSKGLTIEWSDGVRTFTDVATLRRLSPSAEARELRKELVRNPLAVLPAGGDSSAPLEIVRVEPVGHYALRICFSDGHETGIYSWPYLREIGSESPHTG